MVKFQTEIAVSILFGLFSHCAFASDQLEILYSGYGYYHKIGGCDPRQEPDWTSMTCFRGRFDMEDCMQMQLEIDKKICREAPEKRAMLEKTAMCKDTIKLKVGMSKKQTAKIFGEPTYSRMQSCGGAKGVKRWSCEQLTYVCRNARDSKDTSTISIWYGGSRVNHWE